MNVLSLNDLLGQISIAFDAVEAELKGASRFHSKRAAIWSIAIGKELGYKEERIFYLAAAALLHDNALTEYILSEKNNDKQESSVKLHCLFGEENCKALPFYDKMQGFVLYHHEGPQGQFAFLKKEGEYPEEAGIIALADQMDVKYHLNKVEGHLLEELKEFLTEQSGKQFNAEVTEAAIRVLNRELLEKCKDKNIEQSLKQEMPEYIQNISAKEKITLADIFIKVIDYKSEFTKEHSAQIANKSWYLSEIYGYSYEERADLYLAASLHDIGKLFIPIEILEKPGKLEEDEFEIIKMHALYSWEILQSIKGFEQIAIWASDHHEKLDGSGYPFGKKAQDLDFNSRLIACLDIYQAVREKRPYHCVRTHKETMDILYGMAKMGFVDKSICDDLDKNLIKLPQGRAQKP